MERQFHEILSRLHAAIRQWFVEQDFLPSVEVKTESSDELGLASLEMLLRPDHATHLQHELRIRFDISLLDMRESVIQIGVAPWISDKIESPNLNEGTRIYSGVFNEQAVLQAWQNFFLPLYEKATDRNTTSEPAGRSTAAKGEQNK